MLVKADLINRVYTLREGAKFSQYSVTEDGKKFLDFIGVSDKLKESIVAGAHAPQGYPVRRSAPSKTVAKTRGSIGATFARKLRTPS